MGACCSARRFNGLVSSDSQNRRSAAPPAKAKLQAKRPLPSVAPGKEVPAFSSKFLKSSHDIEAQANSSLPSAAPSEELSSFSSKSLTSCYSVDSATNMAILEALAESPPTSVDEADRRAIQRAIDGVEDEPQCWSTAKTCFIQGCGAKGALKLNDQPDCPHVACCLQHLLSLRAQWLDIRHELNEMDDELARHAPSWQGANVPVTGSQRSIEYTADDSIGGELKQMFPNAPKALIEEASSCVCLDEAMEVVLAGIAPNGRPTSSRSLAACSPEPRRLIFS